MTDDPALRIDIGAQEYRDRASRVAELAGSRGLDAILAWSRGGGTVDRYANVLYLTNYYNPWPGVPDSPMWSGQGYAGVLVFGNGTRSLVTNVPEEEWRASEVHCEDAVDEPRLEDGLARTLDRHGLTRARIGIAGEDALPVSLYRRLVEATPDVRWEPADDLLLEARRIKSSAELEIIRRAVACGDAMMEAMLDAVRPGNRELDVYKAGIAAGLPLGVAPYDAPMASGPNAPLFAPRSLPSASARVLEQGDLWHADMYGVWQGYLFDFSRSTVAGTASDEQLEILETATRIVESVIAAIRPGVALTDAWAAGEAARAELAPRAGPSSGEPSKHAYPHFGHTIGLGWEDHWISPSDPRSFEAGMHVAVETTVARPGLGFAMFEQNLIVTDDGVELTSRCDPRPWQTAQDGG